MSRILATSIVLMFLVCLSAAAQAKRRTSSPAKRASMCASGGFLFRCPKGYKVVLDGKADDRLFLAKSIEFRYAVFVVSEPNGNSMSELIPKLVNVLLPNKSQDLAWKNVETDPRSSSRFEIESKRQIAMTSTAYLTLEYRQVDFKGKKLLSGTIVDGYEGPVGIKESFEKGDYTTNGGCFDSLDIIAAFTREKLDPEKGPCFFMISISQ